MVSCRASIALPLLLAVSAVVGQPTQQAVQQQVHSLAGALEPMVERALQRAVERVLAARRSDGDELARLRARLDSLDSQLVELRRTASADDGQCPTCPPCQVSEEPLLLDPRIRGAEDPQPQPNCEEHPGPLPPEQAPYQEPAVRACARSCLQLRNQNVRPQDGVYWFIGMSVPTLCDFSHDDGGWTLLLTAKSRDGWNLLSVLGRRERSPSLEDNYSILAHADAIRDLGTSERFAYRIETQAEKGRQRWGGVWFAPRNYSFVHESPSQTEVFGVKRFDKWTYKGNGIHRRMPWLNMHVRGGGNDPAVLTTGDTSTTPWGSLLFDEGHTGYQHSPWIHPEATQSGTVLYWLREDER